jgi:hypothetical protein
MDKLVLIPLLLSPFTLYAQAPRTVRAVGEAVVSVRPDQVKIQIGVVSQAATAQEAAAQNATQVEAVLAQLRAVLGVSADIRTIAYSVTPNYRYAQGAPPVLTGYTVSNTVEVTSADLAIVGRVIDAATQAGANNVQSLRFGLKDPEPVRAQALAAAARQARAHAEAIASGLSARIGAVLSAEEGAVISIRVPDARETTAAQTPIEAGQVEVRATVTIQAELLG